MSDKNPGRDSSRREFLTNCLHGLAGLTVVGFVAPLVESCSSGSPLSPINSNYSASFDVSGLTADGQAIITTSAGADGYPVMIIRQSAQVFTALSTQCSHSACQVDPPTYGVIPCNCHGSRFDLTGNVLRGPANAPLYKYAVTYNPASRTVAVKAA